MFKRHIQRQGDTCPALLSSNVKVEAQVKRNFFQPMFRVIYCAPSSQNCSSQGYFPSCVMIMFECYLLTSTYPRSFTIPTHPHNNKPPLKVFATDHSRRNISQFGQSRLQESSIFIRYKPDSGDSHQLAASHSHQEYLYHQYHR